MIMSTKFCEWNYKPQNQWDISVQSILQHKNFLKEVQQWIFLFMQYKRKNSVLGCSLVIKKHAKENFTYILLR